MTAAPVAVALIGAGAGLGYAAITGQSPLGELRKALTTGRLDGPPADRKPFGGGVVGLAMASVSATINRAFDAPTVGGGSASPGGAGAAPTAATSSGGAWPNDPTNLVSIGQGSHRLAAPAAAAFHQWEAVYGRKIPVTDSYRSYAQQDAAHDRDPQRFASPDGSAHVEARAVDVNLPALGIGSTMSDAGYKKLFDAAKAAGWCGYHNGVAGKETWHFSYAVCK